MNRMAWLVAGTIVVLAGCETKEREDKVDVQVNTTGARQEAREAGQEAREGAQNAGQEIREGAQQAGQEIREGANQAGAAINETKQEVDIRAALALDTTVDKSGITVIGDGATQTIRLQGTVPTADQKMRAETIAKDKAQGWTIVNELTVAAAPN